MEAQDKCDVLLELLSVVLRKFLIVLVAQVQVRLFLVLVRLAQVRVSDKLGKNFV